MVTQGIVKSKLSDPHKRLTVSLVTLSGRTGAFVALVCRFLLSFRMWVNTKYNK
jgi:hypothetical protein